MPTSPAKACCARSTARTEARCGRRTGRRGTDTTPASTDIAGSCKLDSLAAPTAYRPDGSVRSKASHGVDALAMVMDVNGDGKTTVVLRPTASHLIVLDGATGSIKRDLQL